MGVGDDEKLCIWDINGERPHQVISDKLGRWGQVTCAKWLPSISNNEKSSVSGLGEG